MRRCSAESLLGFLRHSETAGQKLANDLLNPVPAGGYFDAILWSHDTRGFIGDDAFR